MSATYEMKNVNVKAFGVLTTVPNNALAKLIYYLHCVATAIDFYDPNLFDFQRYYELDFEQMKIVYQSSLKLNPSIFINAGVFALDANTGGNRFYKITDETIGIHANRNILIGGSTIRVKNIMVCDSNWLETNYYNPIKIVGTVIREIEMRFYSQQIIPTQTSIIQEKPVVPLPEFGSSPVACICPFCNAAITTQTKSSFNIIACGCFLCFGLLYLCVQAFTKKNILCCDIEHKCPRCGGTLGYYKSC